MRISDWSSDVCSSDLDSTSLCAKKIFIGDIRDQEFLSSVMRSWRPNILFHLAATKERSLTQSAFERSIDVNLVGTLRLLFQAAEIGTLENIIILGKGEE